MARSLGQILLIPSLLLLAASQVHAGDACGQWWGCGYGPGYNAPTPPGGCASGPNNNWGRGCCEIPANWRLRVWEGYHGDPASYHRSLVGAQPDVTHMPKAKVYDGAGFFPNSGGAPCANCQQGAGMYGGYPMPTAEPTPLPIGVQPGVQQGVQPGMQPGVQPSIQPGLPPGADPSSRF